MAARRIDTVVLEKTAYFSTLWSIVEYSENIIISVESGRNDG